MANEEITVRYSDADMEFRQGEDGDLLRVENLDSIKQSILSILSTVPGERVMRPGFGCDLRQFLFEPLDRFTAHSISSTVNNALNTQEPRIELEEVDCTVNYDRGIYELNVRYNIINIQRTDSLKLMLERM